MSVNPNGPDKGSSRLSPDELAQAVARHLRRGEHIDRRRRLDVVTASRIGMILGLLVLGVGVAVAVPWVGRLAGYETPGVVKVAATVTGCPGEPVVGALILGDQVQVVGVTQGGRFFAIRDVRGPGNVAYVEAGAIGDVAEPERLPIKDCLPTDGEGIVAAPGSTTPIVASTTTPRLTSTSIGAAESSTTTIPVDNTARPRRRATASPGPVTETPPPTVTTTPSGPGGPPTTQPPVTTPTTRPPTAVTTTRPNVTTTTRPSVTTTTRPGTTSTTSATTTSTTQPTTTTSEATTTTTESTTTTTEATTTTTEPETTTIP